MEKDRKRCEKIDEFLVFLQKLVKQNPRHKLTSDEVYDLLITFYVPESEKKHNLKREFFEDWINYYKDSKNLLVTVLPGHPYFCIFNEMDQQLMSQNEAIKLYIPIDASHINKGAKDIFNYISSNNMIHISKIGSEVRFDDIVVRVGSEEDAKKICDFVKNNEYIQDGILTSNPFLYSTNGVAMTCDGDMSFNAVLSKIIMEYINERSKNIFFNKVSSDDFYSYVDKLYNRLYVNGSIDKLESFIGESRSKYKYSEVKNIFKILSKSIDVNYSLEDYLRDYKEFSSNKVLDSNFKFGKSNEIVRANTTSVKSTPKKEVTEVIFRNVSEVLKYAYSHMSKKYGEKYTKAVLDDFALRSDEAVFTRDYDVRDYVTKYKSSIVNFLKTNSVNDFLFYVDNKDVILNDACVGIYESFKKSYPDQVTKENASIVIRRALEKYYTSSDLDVFTRRNNSRENIRNYISSNDLKSIICKKYNISESEFNSSYIDLYVNGIIEDKLSFGKSM